jgi:hypothetical protein
MKVPVNNRQFCGQLFDHFKKNWELWLYIRKGSFILQDYGYES